MFDQAFADKKPSPSTRYADFVVSGMGLDDSVDGPAKIKFEVLCVVNGRRTGMPSKPARAAFLCG